MKQNTWGIIYCKKEGQGLIDPKWKKIKSYLDLKGIDYVVSVRSAHRGTEQIVADYLQQNCQTFILIGGDAPLNELLNALLNQCQDRQQLPAVGVIPNGLFNDFARFWGYEDDNYKAAIDAISKRHVRKVDIGCCQYTHTDKTERLFFFNSVNIGLVALITNLTLQTRSFLSLRTLSFLSSALLLCFQRVDYKIRFNINWESVEKKVMTLCIGSGKGYGQTPSAVPYNGLLDVSVMSSPKVGGLCHGFWLLLTGRFLSHKDVMAWRTKKIDIHDLGKARVSIDGRMLKAGIKELTVSIEAEAIDFLIP